VAAHAIALQLASISFMVPLGISQAATVRVGIALGERNREGIRKAGWAALLLTLIFMSLSAIVLFLFPHQLVALFLTPALAENAAPLSLAASFLVVAALFQLFDGTQVTMAANLRGLTDTTWPLIIALIGYWLVGFPVAYLGGFIFGWRGVGIWIGLAAGLAAVALTLTIRFALRERLGLTDRAPA
jgi:MATE family multidrug resistance protein